MSKLSDKFPNVYTTVSAEVPPMIVQGIKDYISGKPPTPTDLPSFKIWQSWVIDLGFNNVISQGVETGVLGIKMKADFNDASTVLSVAQWMEGIGQTHMNIKDFDRSIHSVTIAVGKRIANSIANNYLTLWNQREYKVGLVKNAQTIEEAQAITF